MPAYTATARPVADLGIDERATFIARTYAHLLGAILLFTGIEIVLFKTGVAVGVLQTMVSVPWMLILGAYMIVGWLARGAAAQVESKPLQYAALVGFVAAEAVLFVPLLAIADWKAPGTIQSAAFVTLIAFGALTAVVFITRKDFSFMRSILHWAGICALVLIFASLIWGFQLGTMFSVGMVALAGGAVLYDTSNVLHHTPEDRYVSASLELFASVAMMFWYVLRLMSSRR